MPENELIGSMPEAIARAYKYLLGKQREMATPAALRIASDLKRMGGTTTPPIVPPGSVNEAMSGLGELDMSGEDVRAPGSAGRGAAVAEHASRIPGFLAQILKHGTTRNYSPDLGLEVPQGALPPPPPMGTGAFDQEGASGVPGMLSFGTTPQTPDGGVDVDRMPLVPGIKPGAQTMQPDPLAGRSPEERAAIERVMRASAQGRPMTVAMNALNNGALPPEASPSAPPAAGGALSGVHDFYAPFESVAPSQAPATARSIAPGERELAEQFRERMGKVDRSNRGELTPEQQKKAKLEMFLTMLAAASQPGGKMLPSLAAGGLRKTALERETEKGNKADARDARREEREDVRGEFDLKRGDRDYRARREDRVEDREDKRQDRLERREERATTTAQNQQRIDLLKRQLEQGKWKAVNNAKTGTLVLYDQETGKTRDTGIKFDQSDKRSAQLQLLDHLKQNPDDIEILERINKRAGRDGRMGEKDVVGEALKLIKPDPMSGEPGMSIDEAVQRVLRAREIAGGRAQPESGPRKPETEAAAHAEAKAAIRAGKDPNAINQRLQSWGYRPVQ